MCFKPQAISENTATQKEPSRRRILQAAGMLTVTAGQSAMAAAASPALPTVRLGKYQITRLILGSNPFNGFAYSIPALGLHMKEWYTQERVCQVLHRAENLGINTHQFSYQPRAVPDFQRYQAQGGKMQWILLGGGRMKDDLSLIPEVAKLNPIGIVHHGGVTDERFRNGQHEQVKEFLKRVRDTGVMVGLSTHNPTNIEYVEEHGWDVDFYMTCFYQLSRPREEIRKMLGELPLGDVFLEGDPARMCRIIRRTSKTCLAFKILAAGRKATTREELEAAFRFAYENIKPGDCVIVGMYPRFKDEMRENIEIVQKILKAPV